MTGATGQGPPGLHVFSPAGEPARTIELPVDVGTSDFAFDGWRLVCTRHTGQEDQVVLLDQDRRTLVRLAVEPRYHVPLAFAAGGHELWLYAGERRVKRFRLD